MFGVFAISNTLQDESGLLTVTVMGIWLANMRGVSIVAAAVAALFALRLQEQGYPGADLLVEHYGEIRASLEAAGQPIGHADTWIAAHGRSTGRTVVTNNQREFKRVPGLAHEDWMA